MLRTLSKSDFKLASTCVTKLYYQELGYPRRDDQNPYLAMLAEGGYMVEQLARLMFPGGITLEYGGDPEKHWRETSSRLQQDQTTLFEATLLSGRKLARVDILKKKGIRLDLIEVKSKSFDGDDIEEGPEGPFRAKRNPHAILAPWIPYLEDVAYQTLVLRELFPKAIIVPHLLVVDKSKTTTVEGMPRMFEIRRGAEVNGRKKDVDVRLKVGQSVSNPGEFLAVHDVSGEVDELMPEIASAAGRFVALYDATETKKEQRPLDWTCRECEFRVGPAESRNGFSECWGALAAPKPHLFELYKLGANKSKKERLADRLIRDRKTSLFDVDPAELVKSDGTPTKDSVRQGVQLEHSRSGTTWIGESLPGEIASLGWPLHFIDFETSLLAIPYHRGMRPYEKVAFQWSCHTLDGEGSKPRHSEWLNSNDTWPNAEFAKTLREAVGDHGRILMWTPYERTVLREIRDQLARYEKDDADLVAWLDAVTDKEAHPPRLYDLNDLCLREFFHPSMGGRTSIKVVLDALWKADPTMRSRHAEWVQQPVAISEGLGPYEGLPPIEVAGTRLNVAEGTEAMRAYQAMMYGAESAHPILVKTYRDLLLRYCELDTLAMVLIWDYWRRATDRPA